MAERLAINTGPLVSLAKTGALDIVARLPIEIVCPVQVRDELNKGVLLGHAPIEPLWLEVVELRTPTPPAALGAIDAGEAAVIQLALDLGIADVCMDDWKGRRAALAVGLGVTGTLGLLARAKILGIIPAVRPYTELLAREGRWFGPELVRRVLAGVGE